MPNQITAHRCFACRIVQGESGFSLIEMLASMAIFIIIMLITGQAFDKVTNASNVISKSAVSNIEGIVGLEMLRKDVAAAGYGLSWSVLSSYSSAVGMIITNPVGNRYINDVNDSPSGAPRAIVSLDNAGYNGSDYLVIKSTRVAMNKTAQKSAINRLSGITPSDPGAPFLPTDRVVVINPSYDKYGKATSKTLIGRGTYANASSYYRPGIAPNTDPGDTFIIYGVDESNMRAPFNRVDYFIYRPTTDTAIPDTCAKVTSTSIQSTTGIGSLYKAVMNQANGGFTLYPLLDCVLDMQVVFGVDESTDQNGSVNMHYSVLPASYTAETITSQLKEVRVYILAQDGKKDRTYTYPNSSIYIGESGLGRLFDFTAANISDWQNYRWKTYTIVVKMSL